jgi:GNAT superfamily N-acetyltransferase
LIRAATERDVGTLLGFVHELAAYERAPDEVVATEELLHAALFGPDQVATAIVAEHDGAPVGFALYFWTFSTWLGRKGIWLEDLYVQPAHRGLGLGQELLTELARRCVDAGGGRVEWAVLDWNEPALGFYRRLGATGQDEWTTHRLTGDALTALARDARP